ncbi:hypothetical protein C0993_004397 [Termitomyces sp. T159_Od127]|nr:hypothetical protein C0993_004397 [Termitomyces sp. T159_Od127]
MLRLGILLIVTAGLSDVLASPMQAVLQAPAEEDCLSQGEGKEIQEQVWLLWHTVLVRHSFH